MSLTDYQPLQKTIPLRGNVSVTVRGLGLDDFAVLINEHLRDLDALFALYHENVNEASATAATAQFAITLVREAPAVVAHSIALACDEPDQVAKARKLSLPAQIEIIKAVAHLTFEEAGGARKFLESLSGLLGAIAPAPKKTDSLT